MHIFKKTLSLRAQHTLGYIALLTISAMAVIIIGPYVVRSWNANVKSWDDSVKDSFNDPLMPSNEQFLYRTCPDRIACPAMDVTVPGTSKTIHYDRSCPDEKYAPVCPEHYDGNPELICTLTPYGGKWIKTEVYEECELAMCERERMYIGTHYDGTAAYAYFGPTDVGDIACSNCEAGTVGHPCYPCTSSGWGDLHDRCKMLTTCGNGVVDIDKGELCDGNKFLRLEDGHIYTGSQACKKIYDYDCGSSPKCIRCTEIDRGDCRRCEVCGNGNFDPGEVCEHFSSGDQFIWPGDPVHIDGHQYCQRMEYLCGEAICDDCTNVNTANCGVGCGATCNNNGKLDIGEDCDGSHFRIDGRDGSDVEACLDEGYDCGHASCHNCVPDYSTCGKCGNNKIDRGDNCNEVCDGDDFDGLSCSDFGYEAATGYLTCLECKNISYEHCDDVSGNGDDNTPDCGQKLLYIGTNGQDDLYADFGPANDGDVVHLGGDDPCGLGADGDPNWTCSKSAEEKWINPRDLCQPTCGNDVCETDEGENCQNCDDCKCVAPAVCLLDGTCGCPAGTIWVPDESPCSDGTCWDGDGKCNNTCWDGK